MFTILILYNNGPFCMTNTNIYDSTVTRKICHSYTITDINCPPVSHLTVFKTANAKNIKY